MVDEQAKRTALAGFVELFAPGIEEARECLREYLEDPDSLEGAVMDILLDGRLAYCDGKSDPAEIRGYPADLPTFPKALTREWYGWGDDAEWDPDDRASFLWPPADRCLELGVGLVGIAIDADGYSLGFLDTADLGRFRELAEAGGIEPIIYRTGVPMP